MRPKRLLIVGGGIAGLSAAYHAVKKAREQVCPVMVKLAEAGTHWGGKITTERMEWEGGQFIVEGGPDTFLATKPWGVSLCQQLGLADRLHGTNPQQKNTYVLHRGQLIPLPDGLAMMIPTNIGAILNSNLISWAGKARMGLDFLLPPALPNGDESLGAFVSRRLGREAYENLIEPLMSGIYAGDGDRLSLASTFPYLRDLELKYGSLARGALKMRAAARGGSVQGSRSAFLTPTTGLAEIIEALVDFLRAEGVELQLQCAVRRVTCAGEQYQIEFERYEAEHVDGLILATPAYTSGSILASLEPDLGRLLGEIPYASTATISLAYRLEDVPRQLDGYGYVIPRLEGRKALACTWTSTKFPHRAPQGYALLRVFVGRAGQEGSLPADREALAGIAREELRLSLGITSNPIFSRVFAWERSMPQYNLGHPVRLAHIAGYVERFPGLALAGNGYRGIGIPDCIHSGEQAAESVLLALSRQKTGIASPAVPTLKSS